MLKNTKDIIFNIFIKNTKDIIFLHFLSEAIRYSCPIRIPMGAIRHSCPIRMFPIPMGAIKYSCPIRLNPTYILPAKDIRPWVSCPIALKLRD